jgi:hypothetical protein
MDLYGDKLDLEIRRSRYEDLIEDFEGETGRLCQFLGVDAAPSLKDFSERIPRAGIATPSAAQLSKGLYTEGVGQWRRYAAELAPVLPLLEPWVRRFGYLSE